MNIRILILLIFAVTAAGGSAFMAKNWLASERAEILASVPEVTVFKDEQIEILVAGKDLVPGTFVLEEKLSWQEWPEDALNDQMLKKGDVEKEDFEGYVIRDRIPAGHPVVPTALVHSGQKGFLAAALTPGMRALTVPLSELTGVAGFVFPGDRIDLLHTITLKPEGENTALDRKFNFTQTLLKDVRVLAINQKTELEKDEIRVGSNATIEATPKQAEAITLALHVGKITLSLRSLAEEDKVFPEVFSNEPDPNYQHDVKYPKTLIAHQNMTNPIMAPKPNQNVQPTYYLPEFLQDNQPDAPFRRFEIQDDLSITTDIDVNFFWQKVMRMAPQGRTNRKVQVQRGGNTTTKEFN